MVLKISQVTKFSNSNSRDLNRNFNPFQGLFLKFILGGGRFYKVSVRDIFASFLRLCKHKKSDSGCSRTFSIF